MGLVLVRNLTTSSTRVRFSTGPLWDARLLINGFIGGEFGMPSFVFAALTVVSAFAIFAGLAVYRRELTVAANQEAAASNSVESYRGFVRSCIERLKEGALGSPGSDWRILIAIDEMDRIIDIEDLKNAIIRMRGLFEIRGAFTMCRWPAIHFEPS